MLAVPARSTEKKSSERTWENYELFKTQVRCLLEGDGPITDKVRIRLYLQEHATALHVCNIYEQTLEQRSLAERAHDKGRLEVLNGLVKYYEDRMLRNPRLRFHWEHGASDMMEESTRNQYEKNVRKRHPHDPVDDESPLDVQVAV